MYGGIASRPCQCVGGAGLEALLSICYGIAYGVLRFFMPRANVSLCRHSQLLQIKRSVNSAFRFILLNIQSIVADPSARIKV